MDLVCQQDDIILSITFVLYVLQNKQHFYTVIKNISSNYAILIQLHGFKIWELLIKIITINDTFLYLFPYKNWNC